MFQFKVIMDLEVGTIETEVTAEKKPKIRPNISNRKGSGSNGKNGGGGGGGDDGHNGPQNNDLNLPQSDHTEEFKPNKYRIGMWFLMLVVLMTFGGLIGAYIVIATNGVIEWKPFALPIQVWISTVWIILSSIAYEVSRIKLKSGNQRQAKNWLLITTIAGAAFISSQLLAWFALYQQGVYMQSNPYAGFFYILTAVHALHVLGGISALGYIVLRTWRETESSQELERRIVISTVIGWYWHFMDALWIVLFLLLGFWK
jgi:cytochrome c oxidase subunit III